MSEHRCTFGDKSPAVARFILSDGCFGRPHDREQYLCMQHLVTSEPLGTMQLVEILTAGESWRDDILSRWELRPVGES